MLARLPADVQAVIVPMVTELRNRCLLAGIEGSAMMFAVGIVAQELTEAAQLARPKPPRGKPCTCDNCLGSSCPCRVDAGERLGDLWYCRKQADAAGNGTVPR